MHDTGIVFAQQGHQIPLHALLHLGLATLCEDLLLGLGDKGFGAVGFCRAALEDNDQ